MKSACIQIFRPSSRPVLTSRWLVKQLPRYHLQSIRISAWLRGAWDVVLARADGQLASLPDWAGSSPVPRAVQLFRACELGTGKPPKVVCSFGQSSGSRSPSRQAVLDRVEVLARARHRQCLTSLVGRRLKCCDPCHSPPKRIVLFNTCVKSTPMLSFFLPHKDRSDMRPVFFLAQAESSRSLLQAVSDSGPVGTLLILLSWLPSR